MNNIFQQFRMFMANPQQYMRQMGIPTDQIQTPNDAINWLLRNGKVNQQDYNKAAQMAAQMKNKM